jgi:hypothetical protein
MDLIFIIIFTISIAAYLGWLNGKLNQLERDVRELEKDVAEIMSSLNL